MLGLRGVRLGMTFPDVTRMQVRAILTAATLAAREGVTVLPEIMVPLVSGQSRVAAASRRDSTKSRDRGGGARMVSALPTWSAR